MKGINVNLESLNTLANGNSAFKQKIIKHFCDLADDVLKELRIEVREKDVIGIRDSVHKMKPNLSFFGLTELAEHALQIEQTCEATNPRIEYIIEQSELFIDSLYLAESQIRLLSKSNANG